jgi:hypothetical protein
MEINKDFLDSITSNTTEGKIVDQLLSPNPLIVAASLYEDEIINAIKLLSKISHAKNNSSISDPNKRHKGLQSMIYTNIDTGLYI